MNGLRLPARSLYAVGIFFVSLLLIAVYYIAVCPPILQVIVAMQAQFGENKYLNTLFTAFKYTVMLSGLIALGAMLGWLYINTRKREDWI
ncbi:hypothetical protein DRO19_04610 [Candidatus Bathyarchaeota archaeon]|nr:MAG: hypothetical protein DRO19_04610 [Candidatus Bathyarchaeota archaeon]